jgi:hypothetical protein
VAQQALHLSQQHSSEAETAQAQLSVNTERLEKSVEELRAELQTAKSTLAHAHAENEELTSRIAGKASADANSAAQFEVLERKLAMARQALAESQSEAAVATARATTEAEHRRLAEERTGAEIKARRTLEQRASDLQAVSSQQKEELVQLQAAKIEHAKNVCHDEDVDKGGRDGRVAVAFAVALFPRLICATFRFR